MPEWVAVKIDADERVTATIYPAAPHVAAGITLILAHGAGAGQASGFMVSFAAELAARGINSVTFNFSYAEHGRRVPDRNDRLEACYRAVIESVRSHDTTGRGKLAIGGKSMGGRIASQVAAQRGCDVDGLVFLGYPLHPPGRPEQLRTRHLPGITAPMLFIQGSRDAFGTPDELRPVIESLAGRADLYVVGSGDHSFKVLKKAGVTQEAVYRSVLDHIDGWLRKTVAAS